MEKNTYKDCEFSSFPINSEHVTVEPGDMTRYRFVATQIAKNTWAFAPMEANTFAYPSVIRYDECDDMDKNAIFIADAFMCNVCTVLVCIEFIKQKLEDII